LAGFWCFFGVLGGFFFFCPPLIVNEVPTREVAPPSFQVRRGGHTWFSTNSITRKTPGQLFCRIQALQGLRVSHVPYLGVGKKEGKNSHYGAKRGNVATFDSHGRDEDEAWADLTYEQGRKEKKILNYEEEARQFRQPKYMLKNSY